MDEPICGTCRFHVRAHPAARHGACHGEPPSVLRHYSVRGLELRHEWPVTRVDDWCGRWQAVQAQEG